jgi:hypothetical protein
MTIFINIIFFSMDDDEEPYGWNKEKATKMMMKMRRNRCLSWA